MQESVQEFLVVTIQKCSGELGRDFYCRITPPRHTTRELGLVPKTIANCVKCFIGCEKFCDTPSVTLMHTRIGVTHKTDFYDRVLQRSIALIHETTIRSIRPFYDDIWLGCEKGYIYGQMIDSAHINPDLILGKMLCNEVGILENTLIVLESCSV